MVVRVLLTVLKPSTNSIWFEALFNKLVQMNIDDNVVWLALFSAELVLTALANAVDNIYISIVLAAYVPTPAFHIRR